MNTLKKFEEYLNKGIARKINPDPIRARDLVEESDRDRDFFMNEIRKKITLNDKNANNFIDQAYNILMKLLRAKILIVGYKCSGFAAHEAEVSYMDKLGFSEADIEFMDELRKSRNGISYYGKIFNVEYAQKVLNFFDVIHPKLKEIAKI